jgi:CheY-like chemotaxis protein
LRTLIVDDEPIARRVLREELELLAGVEVVGEAENGKDALLRIEKLAPDLVILDLQMPVMSGFEVVRHLTGTPLPAVVIVTAYDEHAIQAFDAGAVDYLLKPVNETRLRKAVERVRSMLGRPIEIANQVARIAAAGDAAQGGRAGRLGLFPNRFGRDSCIPGGQGISVDYHRKAAPSRHSIAAGYPGASMRRPFSARSSQRHRQRGPRAQNECPEQSALACYPE